MKRCFIYCIFVQRYVSNDAVRLTDLSKMNIEIIRGFVMSSGWFRDQEKEVIGMSHWAMIYESLNFASSFAAKVRRIKPNAGHVKWTLSMLLLSQIHIRITYEFSLLNAQQNKAMAQLYAGGGNRTHDLHADSLTHYPFSTVNRYIRESNA